MEMSTMTEFSSQMKRLIVENTDEDNLNRVMTLLAPFKLHNLFKASSISTLSMLLKSDPSLLDFIMSTTVKINHHLILTGNLNNYVEVVSDTYQPNILPANPRNLLINIDGATLVDADVNETLVGDLVKVNLWLLTIFTLKMYIEI